jgi:hypothetical protein
MIRISVVIAAVLSLVSPATRAGTDRLVHEFPKKLADIQSARKKFTERWQEAGNGISRAEIRRQARSYVVRTIVQDIFPPWMGTPWHMGEDDDASMPHQSGKRVSCSQFVTAVLQNVGLRLDSRPRWAAARSLYIQRSLAPRPGDVHRFLSISPSELSRRLARLKDGLYLIGLNCHVGFVQIDSGRVRFIHSNYVDPQEGVTDEKLSESSAIANSQPAGYWVTPLFQDDRLIEFWLTGKPVPLQKLGQK